jgi:hypothetical protein
MYNSHKHNFSYTRMATFTIFTWNNIKENRYAPHNNNFKKIAWFPKI